MRYHQALRYLFILSAIVIASFSCTPEEEQISFDTSAKLRFSTDTVFFDTLFTTLGSVTKRFRVYNDAENAVNISEVSLGENINSPFSIYVNGLAGPQVNNVRLLGKDSLLVLVEVSIDPRSENLPFLVTDQINFTTNGNNQNVKLVAWGQEANFLRDSVLACNTTFTADKPYVIYNSILVDEGCTLTIEPGTKIYSHNGSFIFIRGSIQAIGNPENRITFTNDRFEPPFDNAPGQWGGMIFLEGSNNNIIEYSDIRNANVGIYLGTPDEDQIPDLVLGHTRIENIGGNSVIPSIDELVQPGYGILAITSDLYAYNVLVNNCQLSTVANLAGGNYRYEHCTFANFSFDFFRRDAAMVLSDNLLLGDNSALIADLDVLMTNSILWGSLREELLVSNSEQSIVNIVFNNNILKTELAAFIEGNSIENPKFFDPQEYQYQLDTLSPAKDVGLLLPIITDLEGKTRDTQPDLGAFERIEN